MARGKHSADGGYYFDQKTEELRSRRYEEEPEEDLENDKEYYDDDEYDDMPDGMKIKIICAAIAVALIIVIAVFVTTRKPKTENNANNVISNTVETKVMESTYEGYKVLGKIKIEKLGVEQYILDSTEENALKNGIARIYGGSLNNYGNLCLAGHNFDNMFGKLNELDKGDIITIIEKDFSETEYEVKDILSVEPTDLEALIPNENKVEITLITCENASTKRLIIKAEEK